MIPLFDANPTRRAPAVTFTIIALNFAVFFYMLFLGGPSRDIFIYRFSPVPWEITHAAQLPLPALQHIFTNPPGYVPAKQIYATLGTSLFLHDGWLHILGNMLFLWIFGNNVEDVMGRVPFAIFYLFSGVFGTLTHIAVYPQSIVPLLGASGAISGVLGAYMILFPRAWIYTWVFLFIVPIPAFLVIGLWLLTQFLQGLTMAVGGVSSGTAWFAHLGGAAAGLIITVIFYPTLRRRRDMARRQVEMRWRVKGGPGLPDG